MKRVLLLIITFFCSSQIYSQEPKNPWSIGINLSHFTREKNNELSIGNINYNINPGIELLYTFNNNALQVKTGISLQHVLLRSHQESDDRFRFGEISLPILFELNSKVVKNKKLSFSTGMYIGHFLYFSWDDQIHGTWHPVAYEDKINYSKKNFFMDVYFAAAFKFKPEYKSEISISPFLHYRFKENWMEHYRTSTYYGIKFGTNLKKKEK